MNQLATTAESWQRDGHACVARAPTIAIDRPGRLVVSDLLDALLHPIDRHEARLAKTVLDLAVGAKLRKLAHLLKLQWQRYALKVAGAGLRRPLGGR